MHMNDCHEDWCLQHNTSLAETLLTIESRASACSHTDMQVMAEMNSKHDGVFVVESPVQGYVVG